MSKSKTKSKTASKNNPTIRERAVEYFYNDKKVVPVKYIDGSHSYMAAMYDGANELVRSKSNNIVLWKCIKYLPGVSIGLK